MLIFTHTSVKDVVGYNGELKRDMNTVKNDINGLHEKLDKHEKKIDKIEEILLNGYKNND